MFLSTSLIFFSVAHASSVEKVAEANGSQPARVQLLLDQNVQVGDKLFLINSDQKKVALVQITKIAADQKKALAQVLKGKASVGLTAQMVTNTSSSKGAGEAASANQSWFGKDIRKLSYGGVVGLSMNTLKTKIAQYSNSTPESATLSGMGYNLKGVVDYRVLPQWTLSAMSGLDQFTTKGSITNSYCDNGASKNCSVEILYLTAEAYLKYNYMADKAWVGLGYGLLLPMSSSLNIPSLSKPGLQNTVFLSTGYNLKLSPQLIMPFNLHYGLDLVDASVETTSIYIQTGIMIPY